MIAIHTVVINYIVKLIIILARGWDAYGDIKLDIRNYMVCACAYTYICSNVLYHINFEHITVCMVLCIQIMLQERGDEILQKGQCTYTQDIHVSL